MSYDIITEKQLAEVDEVLYKLSCFFTDIGLYTKMHQCEKMRFLLSEYKDDIVDYKVKYCIFEYGDSGFMVELRPDNLWDAYLPSPVSGYKLWQSINHKTLKEATDSIVTEYNRLRKINDQV